MAGQAILTCQNDLAASLMTLAVEISNEIAARLLNEGDCGRLREMIHALGSSASASYSEYQQQDFKYASSLAANNLARKIVELMERKIVKFLPAYCVMLIVKKNI